MRYSQMPSHPTTLCELLPIARISPRPSLQRRQDDASLEALAESIRQYGLLRPVIVRHTASGRYVVVSGNRRLAACRMLGMACMSVRVLRDDARWQTADCLMETLLMGRMHYLEEADALRALHEIHGMSWEAMARALNSEAALLREQSELAAIQDELKALLMEEGVPLGIALALLQLRDRRERFVMAERIARERPCIRDAKLLVAAALHGRNRELKRPIKKNDEVYIWEEMNDVGGKREKTQTDSVGRRMIGVVRDARLYFNSIRQITAQMQAAGFRVALAERRVGGEMEIVIRVPVRRRRSERYQSM